VGQNYEAVYILQLLFASGVCWLSESLENNGVQWHTMAYSGAQWVPLATYSEALHRLAKYKIAQK